MDILLAIGLLHIVSGLVWAAGVVVLSLILLAARRDEDATLRALPETATLARRVLRPAILVATLSGLVLAAEGGLLTEAWVVLSTALALGALVAEAMVIGPACRRAHGMPRGAALVRGRQALGQAGLGLGAQAAAIGLAILTPGWGGAAILAGLAVCLALVAALWREAGAGAPLPR